MKHTLRIIRFSLLTVIVGASCVYAQMPAPAQEVFAAPVVVPTEPAAPAPQAEAIAPITTPLPAADASLAPLLQAPTLPSTTVTTGEQMVSQAAEDTTEIYLNFDNASIMSIINYLGEQRKINMIPHKDLEGVKVTLSSRTPMTLTKAWDAVLTMLELNGFSMIEVGGIYRVVQNANNGQEPLPIYSSAQGVEPESLPDNDMMIRYAYFLKNIKTDTAISILGKMIDEKNIQENRDLNVLIIKDSSINIKTAMAIIKELDSGGMREAIEVIPLKWTTAENVKKLFEEIIGQEGQDKVIKFNVGSQKEAAYFSPHTKILKDDIHNNLILLGTQKNITRIKDFLYKYIDVPIENAESRLHVKELNFMPAADMKAILEDIIKPPTGTTSEKSLMIEGGYKVFEDVVITAEQGEAGDDNKFGSGNRLIVAANKEDWSRIESFINMLDKPQPQVAIEIMIVDVTLKQVRALGAQMYGIKGKPLGKNINIEFTNLTSGRVKTSGNNSGGSYDPDQSYLTYIKDEVSSPTLVTLGKVPQKEGDSYSSDNIWGYLRAIMNIENNQVVSQPYLVVNNNHPGVFSTNTKRRVPGRLDPSKSITAVVAQDDVSATVEAKITPRINLAGVVDLSIDMTVEEFIASTQADQPSKTTRKMTTKAKLAVGEVLVIGGLTNSKQVESLYQTPVLSQIPIIGNLFKSKNKDKTETNLYVFIRPSIIKPKFEGNPDEYTQLKLDYAKYQLMKNDTYVEDKDPIQRWFFKPSNQTVKQKVGDYAKGILRPIDNFTYGKSRPVTVNLKQDPFFSVTETIAEAKNAKRQFTTQS